MRRLECVVAAAVVGWVASHCLGPMLVASGLAVLFFFTSGAALCFADERQLTYGLWALVSGSIAGALVFCGLFLV